MNKEIIGYTTAITVLPKVDSGPDTNGHEYVDLGLPSGALWATMNVGASSETDYGNYYMYGMGSKTYDNTDTPYAGTEDPLALSADTAAQVWGGDWHMPTKTQMEELIANTTYQWIEDYQSSGVNGGLFTATNGNSIFFPAGGQFYNNNISGNAAYNLSSTPNYSNVNLLVSGQSGPEIPFAGPPIAGGYSVRPVIG